MTTTFKPPKVFEPLADETQDTPTVFATEGTPRRKFCGYCKSKGWPGTSHDESDCRTKKRDANQRPKATTHATKVLFSEQENTWAECSATEHNNTNTPTEGWWADSCSTVHITNDIQDVPNAQPCVRAVKTGGGVTYSTHTGMATVQGLDLIGPLVVPNFPRKIIATGEITSKGGELTLTESIGKLSYRGTTIQLLPVGKLFKVQEPAETLATAMATDAEWHERYGHLPFPVFSKVSEAPSSLRSSHYECEKCKKAKTTTPVAAPQQYKIRTTQVGELIHSDLCGPFTEDMKGNKYIITLIDDYSRFTMAGAIKQKSDVASKLQEFIARFEVMTKMTVQNIRTDHGGEYRSREFTAWLRKKGIDTRPTVPYHSQTNSVAERTNRTIVTNIRANLGTLPRSLWSLAMAYSVFTRNRLPHITLNGKCPIEVISPNINMEAERQRFRLFGQKVYTVTYSEGKLTDRAAKAILVRYTNTFEIYQVMLESRRLVVAKNPQLRTEQEPCLIETMHTPPSSQ